MAKDYPRRTGKYILPRSVYHQSIWYIRDYYRVKDCLDSISVMAPIEIDDMPKSQTNKTNDIVFNLVNKREKFKHKIDLIDKAFACIPKEYKKGVWENIHFNRCFPLDAHRTTYSTYKSKVIYRVAKELNLI